MIEMTKVQYRCKRARTQSFLIGFGFALLILISAASFSGRHTSSGTTAAWFELIAAVPFLALGCRGFLAGTVQLDGDELIYRTKYVTHKYRKSEISDVSSSVRWWLTRSWSQPWLQLASGRKVWLVDWSVPPPRSKDSVSRFLQDAEFAKQQEMVSDIHSWLAEANDVDRERHSSDQ
jgi:hypothetical protein